MLQSFHIDKTLSSFSRTFNGQPHSCPYCRCRSQDAAINIKLVPRSSACNFRVQKDLMTNTVNNTKADGQNVYYRTFQSPRARNGLSPNGNKKIVIQYVSPQNKINNTNPFRPFAKPMQNLDLKATYVISSPIKTSPRNIYTNENTPPKAKFLQKMSQRKNSQQKMQYTTPVHELTFSNNKKVKKTSQQEKQSVSPISLVIPVKEVKKRQSQQVSIRMSIDYYPKVPETQTKNVIKRASGQESYASPFDSIGDSRPGEAQFPSDSSTPINTTWLQLTKHQIGPSIKQMISGNKGSQRAIGGSFKKIKINNTENRAKKIENTPRSIEMSPGKSSYSHERFDKTLGKGKPNNVHASHENELMYSESDRQSLNHGTNSQKNIPQSPLYKKQFQEALSRSEQNIRPASQQQIQSQKNKLESIEICDNFSTPKSKYETAKPETKGKCSGGIKFYPLGDNKKSRGSKASVGNSQKSVSNAQSRRLLELSNVVKIQTEQALHSKQEIKKNTATPTSLQTSATQPQTNINKPLKTHSISQEPCPQQPSKIYGAQLAQELDLNYDYYFYQPVHNPHLYQNEEVVNKDFQNHNQTDEHQEIKSSSVQESMSLDVTF